MNMQNQEKRINSQLILYAIKYQADKSKHYFHVTYMEKNFDNQQLKRYIKKDDDDDIK